MKKEEMLKKLREAKKEGKSFDLAYSEIRIEVLEEENARLREFIESCYQETQKWEGIND